MDLSSLEYKKTAKMIIVDFNGNDLLDNEGNKMAIDYYSPDTKEYRIAQRNYRDALTTSDDEESGLKALCLMLSELTHKCHNVLFNDKIVTIDDVYNVYLKVSFLRGQALQFVNKEVNFTKGQGSS